MSKNSFEYWEQLNYEIDDSLFVELETGLADIDFPEGISKMEIVHFIYLHEINKKIDSINKRISAIEKHLKIKKNIQ